MGAMHTMAECTLTGRARGWFCVYCIRHSASAHSFEKHTTGDCEALLRSLILCGVAAMVCASSIRFWCTEAHSCRNTEFQLWHLTTKNLPLQYSCIPL